MAHLHIQILRSLSGTSVGARPALLQCYRTYSSRPSYGDYTDDEFEAAREWHKNFRLSSIPAKMSITSYSCGSGPGGQKTNKTSSKATTAWPVPDLLSLLPNILHQALRTSRYYAASSDSISIQCDTHRNRTQNKDETFKRLYDEIQGLYRGRVPGVTPPEQKKKIEGLKRAETAARLKMKKMHGDKKRSRSGGSGGGWD